MQQLSPVIWSEGMHLAQHHFQAQSRRAETSLHFAVSQLCVAPYGLLGAEIDAEALRNGTLALLHARGVMPDGLAFDLPAGSAPPPPLDVRDAIAPAEDGCLVALALPRLRPGGPNCALPPAPADGLRWVAETRAMTDEATGLDERPVQLGRPNFRLVLEPERADGPGASEDPLVRLPLARLRRAAAGGLELDPEYVPPCLQIGASAAITARLHRLVEALTGAADALAASADVPRDVARHGERGELARLWLRHTVHAALGPLQHLGRTRQTHPERLYLELARLAGALCTFALDGDATALPAYDHDRLGPCLAELDRQIRARLGVALPTHFLAVPLLPHPTQPFVLEAALADARARAPGTPWLLALRSRHPASWVADQAPHLAKLCGGGDNLAKLLARGLPGLVLTHTPVPPPAIPARADTVYFHLAPERTPGCADLVRQTGTVGLYAPDALGLTAAELLVVLPD